ncbi:MAG: cell division protein ZapA [Lachnospiraceae bacterium]
MSASKATTEVIIDGKVYTMSGYEGEEYLQKVAAYINGKIAECNEIEGFKRQSLDMRTMMIELNLADDYFKEKEKAEQLAKELEQQKSQSYDVKHDLVSMQIQIEEAQKAVKELEAENKELLLSKTRLEASLEEVLFHGNHKDPKYEKVSKEEVQQTVEERLKEKEQLLEETTDAVESAKSEQLSDTEEIEQNKENNDDEK